MSLNNTYHKITGYATLVVLLWNIAGWLGFGLVLNHSHEQNQGAHCEVNFCFCEVEEGQSICTCHHHGMNENGHHSADSDQQNSFCYFSKPHTSSQTASQALVNISIIHALYLPKADIIILLGMQEYKPEQTIFTPAGIVPDLLRPPRG